MHLERQFLSTDVNSYCQPFITIYDTPEEMAGIVLGGPFSVHSVGLRLED